MTHATCSHEVITWKIVNNSVTSRIINNSLIHKFSPSQKIRRRTKALNAEIKKQYSGVREYKRYVDLKTKVLRNWTDDTDTSDSNSDVDYDIIYSSPSKQTNYVRKNFEKLQIFDSEEDCKEVSIRHKKRSKQKIVKNDNNVSFNLRKRRRSSILDNEGNILEDNNHCFETQSNEQALSLPDSQNCMPSTVIKSRNKYTRRKHRNSDATDNELSSKDNAIVNKTKRVKRKKIWNDKDHIATIKDTDTESNTEFNSHLDHQSSPSQSTNVDNSNELNTHVNSEDSKRNKLTAVINENSINAKNHDNMLVSRKPVLLKNVRRNLIPALEKANSMNNDKDVKTDKNVEEKLNYDQLYPAIPIDQHSTPLNKTQTEKKDSLPDTLSLDQQKDSGIDEDLEDKFVNIKNSNNSLMKQNMKKNMEKTPSSQRRKKIDKVIETAENCEENVKDTHSKFNNDILEKQISKEQESSREENIKKSLQLSQIDMTIETNQKDKEDKHLVKMTDSDDIQKQQLLSPKQDYTKDVHSESYDHIQEKEDNREIDKPAEEEEEISRELDKVNKDIEDSSLYYKEERDSEEEKGSSGKEMTTSHQLNQISNATEICSTNYENQKHSVKSQNLCDSKKQQLSPKENHIKDVCLNEEKEEKCSLQLNQVDKNTNIHLISQENKTCVEAETTHNTQKQHLLPKVTCTEILNKRYKIIDKKAIEGVEKIDNVNNNIDAAECTPKKNTLTHCPNVINNQQETVMFEEENDIALTLETDNEEDNVNYMSPQARKRLQQQAKLNLVVNTDSSESDDEHIITKNSREQIYTSDTSHCNEDELNDEINEASKQMETDVLGNEDICEDICKEATSVPAEVVKQDSTNIKKGIEKKAVSTESSSTQLNISSQYRPRNLQQLIEDEELLVETMPASFTLVDLSEDEDAFILNIPSKAIQCNLQGQMTITEKSIKFNKSKYRIVCREAGTTSCIFATGNNRKPYKLVNIKNIGTITLREKLQDSEKPDV